MPIALAWLGPSSKAKQDVITTESLIYTPPCRIHWKFENKAQLYFWNNSILQLLRIFGAKIIVHSMRGHIQACSIHGRENHACIMHGRPMHHVLHVWNGRHVHVSCMHHGWYMHDACIKYLETCNCACIMDDTCMMHACIKYLETCNCPCIMDDTCMMITQYMFHILYDFCSLGCGSAVFPYQLKTS